MKKLKYFNQCKSLDEVKAEYKRYVQRLLPREGNAGDPSELVHVENEYHEISQRPKFQDLTEEVKEEYSADVLDYEFLGYRDVHREHNGDKTHWLALDFKVLYQSLQLSISYIEMALLYILEYDGNYVNRCKEGKLECVLKDDMVKLYKKIDSADYLIFGTPIYWFGPTAKMKLLLDWEN